MYATFDDFAEFGDQFLLFGPEKLVRFLPIGVCAWLRHRR
jgi:hypothetical protein